MFTMRCETRCSLNWSMSALRISGELNSVMSPVRSRMTVSPTWRAEIFKGGRCGMRPMFCQSLRLDAMGFNAPRASDAVNRRFPGQMTFFIASWIRGRGKPMQLSYTRQFEAWFKDFVREAGYGRGMLRVC